VGRKRGVPSALLTDIRLGARKPGLCKPARLDGSLACTPSGRKPAIHGSRICAICVPALLTPFAPGVVNMATIDV